MTKVKICGIRNLRDAQVASEAGADFIGLVFVPKRRRRLEPEAAREIVVGLKSSGAHAPRVVGLFADQPLEEVNRIIEICNLDLAQLCGVESQDYCRETGVQVIKVLHVPDSPSSQPPIENLAERIEAHREAGNIVTLDRLVEGLQGGTGEGFDWGIAAKLAGQGSVFMLAGGLSPVNVAQAVLTVRPWGLDVSSGVETNGVKDHRKILDFVRNAKRPSVTS